MNKRFNKNGFVTIRNFVLEREKIIISNILYESFKDILKFKSKKNFSIENKSFHNELLKLRKSNPKNFGEIYDNFKLNAQLRSIFYTKKFLKIFSSALDTKIENIYLNGFMLRLDPPNDSRNSLNWHQDSPYYLMNYPTLNSGVCWMALTKNSRKNGTLIFVPNSHSKVVKSKINKGKKFSSTTHRIKISKHEKENCKNLNQKFGDISLLHINLKHKSGINTSKKFRLTLACRFHDMSSTFNSGNEIYKYKKGTPKIKN